MDKIHIPRALAEREQRLMKEFHFYEKFIEGPLIEKKTLPYISPWIQPIDHQSHRLMKVEMLDSQIIFSLTDHRLTWHDLAALISAASVLTSDKFTIIFDGKKRAQLKVPKADKILPSTGNDVLLDIIGRAINNNIPQELHMNGTFDNKEKITFTANDWKAGTEINYL